MPNRASWSVAKASRVSAALRLNHGGAEILAGNPSHDHVAAGSRIHARPRGGQEIVSHARVESDRIKRPGTAVGQLRRADHGAHDHPIEEPVTEADPSRLRTPARLPVIPGASPSKSRVGKGQNRWVTKTDRIIDRRQSSRNAAASIRVSKQTAWRSRHYLKID